MIFICNKSIAKNGNLVVGSQVKLVFRQKKKSAKDIIYFNFTILSYQSCPKDDNLILETILKLAEATVKFFFSLSRVAIPSSSSNMLFFWK